MADETTATDTTETETSTTEATETEQTTATTDKADAGDTGADKTDADKADTDASLMNGGKGPDDEGEGEADKDGDKDEAAALPEKYELTVPEGFEVNDEMLAEADPIFRDLKLDNDQANKLMPLAGKFAERLFAQQQEAFDQQATDWAKAAKADAEIGGKNWSETETLVAKALDKFGAAKGTDFRTLLDDTKLGNHPEMIRIFRKIGAALGEDGDLARSDAGAPVSKPREEVMYPEDVPKKEPA